MCCRLLFAGEALYSLALNDLITLFFFLHQPFYESVSSRCGTSGKTSARTATTLFHFRLSPTRVPACEWGSVRFTPCWTTACFREIHKPICYAWCSICVAISMKVLLVSQVTPGSFWTPRGQTSSATALTTTSTCSTSVGSKPLQVKDDPKRLCDSGSSATCQ